MESLNIVRKIRSRLSPMRLFHVFETMGYHLTPNHFYFPIPDTRSLGDYLWERESQLVGVDMNTEGQMNLLSIFESTYKNEYEKIPKDETDSPHLYFLNNNDFFSIDGLILYCMIRYFKPNKIIEVGSGYSTLLAAQALEKNQLESGKASELIAIEPYPNEILQKGFPGLSRLIKMKVQDVPLSEFEKLGKNDILFIDSSHVLSIGNDVQYEYLEILPRLNPGVLIHIHDIFFPNEYPKKWTLERHHFWTEQYILQAFLAFNKKFEVIWASNYMLAKHPDKFEDAFNYRIIEGSPYHIASFWMRRKE